MFEGHVGLQPCNISFIKTPQANPPFELNLLSLTISPYPQWSQTVEPEAWAQWIPLRRMPRELFLSFRGTRQCGAEFWSASVSAQLRRRSCDVATDQYIEGRSKIGWFHTISYRHQDWDFFFWVFNFGPTATLFPFKLLTPLGSAIDAFAGDCAFSCLSL